MRMRAPAVVIMYCRKCAYNLDDPNAAVCRRCGRYCHNKAVQIVAVALAGVLLALVSHYLLTGGLFGGNRLLWTRSALTVPGSIYKSPAYMAAVGIALGGIVVTAALAGFHYGPGWGLLVAALTGSLSGVHLGGIALAAVSLAAGLPRLRRVPPFVWPVLATGGGTLYYVYLAVFFGPEDAPLYRCALIWFVVCVGIAALVVVLVESLLSAAGKYRSSHYLVFTAVLAVTAVALTLGATNPAEIEANLVTTLYRTSRIESVPLGDGFTSGAAAPAAASTQSKTAPEKQLSHVFDTLTFVAARQAEASRAADDYIRRYPDAPGAADVLLLKATMLNARVDMKALKHFNRLECYFDRIAPESTDVYETVIRRFPKSPQAALARYRLAEGFFQRGAFRKASKGFAEAEKALSAFVPPGYYPVKVSRPTTVLDLFRMSSADRTRMENKLYEALLASRRRVRLIRENSDYAGQPLARLAALDEHSEAFDTIAAELAVTYKDSRLVDNIELILAARLSDPIQRLSAIKHLLDKYATSDVRDHMLLELARAYLAGNISGDGPRKAELALRRFLADYPTSTYAGEARRLLESISPQGH